MTRSIKAALLCFFFSLCGAAMIVTHHIRLQTPPPAPHQLYAVVEQHLAAFRAADYSSAYRQTASGVQQKFTAPQYAAMIRRDYGDIATARWIEFGFVKVNGPTASLQVFIRQRSGGVRTFLYSLIAEGDSWKIDSVQPMPSLVPGRRLAGLSI
jgi:hypothetical protein